MLLLRNEVDGFLLPLRVTYIPAPAESKEMSNLKCNYIVWVVNCGIHYTYLTYNIHHSRGTATNPLAAVIGRAIVSSSIIIAQKITTSGNCTIAILITTSIWYKTIISTTCRSPAVSYLTSGTHSSACQSDRWCCPVVWWLIVWLKRSVADINDNLEGWKTIQYAFFGSKIIHTK